MSHYKVSPDCQIPNLDDIYLRYLGYKTNGYFIEIGAYDGKTISNTVFLADLGWQGIYVEPVEQYAKLCIKRHKKNSVQVLQLAVGSKDKKVTVYIGGEISTTLANPKQFYESIGFPDIAKQHKGKSTVVRQITLEKILQKVKTPRYFDLLVLDTEGTEWDILSVFPIKYWLPKMVIVEMHEKSTDWTKSEMVREQNIALNRYFTQAGYKKIFSDTINTIFVKKKPWYTALLKHFEYP